MLSEFHRYEDHAEKIDNKSLSAKSRCDFSVVDSADVKEFE